MLEAFSYRSRAHFYTGICEQTDKFDLNKSLGMPYFCWADTDGNQYQFRILRDFLESINKICGTKYDLDKSVTRRNSFIVFADVNATPSAETVAPKASVEAVEAPVDDGDIEQPVTDETLSEEQSDSVQRVDMDYAKALYDSSKKKASKDSLDKYAAEFNIQLDKRKTFEGMIEELESLI